MRPSEPAKDHELFLPAGFVDIHCHLLPELDDGPKSLPVALQMCGSAQTAGTAAVIATPHANHRYQFDPVETRRQRARVEESYGGSLRLFTGSEVEISLETLPAALGSPVDYTLAGSRYLLVELMAGAVPPNLERVLDQLGQRGLTPILAHPERNPQLQLQPARLVPWIRQGCLIQLTGDSLTGRMGRRAQTAALELLRCGMAHFVASDGHGPVQRPPRLLEAYRIVCRMLSPEWADLLFVHNPRAVLEDRPLPLAAEPAAAHGWAAR